LAKSLAITPAPNAVLISEPIHHICAQSHQSIHCWARSPGPAPSGPVKSESTPLSTPAPINPTISGGMIASTRRIFITHELQIRWMPWRSITQVLWLGGRRVPS
jgi:hypothetical protein